ncbi:MAG: hypothetical protein SFU27_07360 [Thermonemataceae bacterium]|nr:hypothetical protein [Thermonemataceae bacterium]
MKILYAYFFFLVYFWAYYASGQYIAEGKTLTGFVEDTEGTVWRGQLKYDTDKKTVIVDIGNQSKTFNARNVSYFEFYDTKVQSQRRFLSLMYDAKNTNYESAHFFELLFAGKNITLLGTEYLETQMNPNPWYGVAATTFSYRIVSEFYVLVPAQKIKKIKNNKRKNFITYFPKNQKKVEDFIKSNRLSLQKRVDVVKIFEYYDSL